VSGNETSESKLAKILESFVTSTAKQNEITTNLITQQSIETNKKLDGLTTVVEEIAKTQIRSEERHTQYDDRFERLERNQYNSGKQIKILNDNQIKMDADLTNNAKKWSMLSKVALSITVVSIGGAITAIVKLAI